MKRCGIIKGSEQDSGVSSLIEYLMISGILMILMVILMLNVNTVIMQVPARSAQLFGICGYRKWGKHKNC